MRSLKISTGSILTLSERLRCGSGSIPQKNVRLKLSMSRIRMNPNFGEIRLPGANVRRPSESMFPSVWVPSDHSMRFKILGTTEYL
jgi:hypothetical protein